MERSMFSVILNSNPVYGLGLAIYLEFAARRYSERLVWHRYVNQNFQIFALKQLSSLQLESAIECIILQIKMMYQIKVNRDAKRRSVLLCVELKNNDLRTNSARYSIALRPARQFDSIGDSSATVVSDSDDILLKRTKISIRSIQLFRPTSDLPCAIQHQI